ncbi:hypothetical protein DFP93_12610 [Aneurinibacillus soli]|uniref:Uncharacterized protein n=1 Tax=Aneurinibacillus soli TaxID=1500254 RepID=A0A0U5BHV9_9BACL|nr:hypothetical protein [Aneurinibacillus soli]PYE58033.1 hypothetical protein DFP93_12610 [Aneurinibacillus soli]BAU29911.1 hypothetical protein CB4_04183 [Aneurinibacillus soli]
MTDGKHKQSAVWTFFWLTFSTAMLLKYGYAGWNYYPTIDDWIQYGLYRMYDDKYHEIFLHLTYHTRPLASLADLYVWGRFWPNLAFPLFVMTAMHTASCYLLYRVFRKLGLPFGILSAVLFGLLPVGSEATYWLSASTRLVVGMFFMLVSLVFLIEVLEKNRKAGYLIGFFLFQLLSFGFYEQIIALGAASSCLILLWKKRWIWLLLPISNVGLIAGYYVVCKAGGNVEERGQTVAAERFLNHAGGVFHQFYTIMIQVHGEFYSKGFVNSLRVLGERHSYFYVLAILFVSVGIGWLAYRLLWDAEQSGGRRAMQAGLGIILTVIPLAPFFVLNDTGLALRNVFPSFIGIVLLLEMAFRLLLRRRAVYGAVTGLLVFVFLVIHVGEVTDYQKVSEADRQMVQHIVAAAEPTGKFRHSSPVYLFGAKEQLVPVSVSFLNHVRSSTANDWSLYGAIRAIEANRQYSSVTQVPEERVVPLSAVNVETGLLLGLEQNGIVTVLHHKEKTAGSYELLRPDGTYFGVYDTSHQVFTRQ